MNSMYRSLLMFLAGVAAFTWMAWESVVLMASDWLARDEYSHGILIPFLTAYLIYAKGMPSEVPTNQLVVARVLTITGAATVAIGALSTIHALSQFGFVLGVIGMFGTCFGFGRGRSSLAVPLALLMLMVPLPHFLHQAVSAQLQLGSSQLGAWMISLMGISVYLHGNVIDLGVYKLQVIEACDGLRYLFPLMSLGLIVAYLFKAPVWQRVVLFLSTIPLTVAMNSFRIAIIGVLVQHWGTGMAEGFLHDFQGWSVFLVCVALLLLEAKLMMVLSGNREALVDMFDFRQSEAAASGRVWETSHSSAARGAAAMAGALLVSAIVLEATLPLGTNFVSQRKDFLDFPLSIEPGDWEGRRRSLEAAYVEGLAMSDYLVADYRSADQALANLYIAYYQSQISGKSIHSPRTCIPGDGWEINSFERVELIDGDGRVQPVNRALISKGNAQQVVYYWFEQRGRVLANEYLVKWYILRDSLLMGRTDGALVRLMAPVLPGSTVEDAERSLRDLFVAVRETIPEYVPG